MQNFPFYVASNLLKVAANRQHSAGRFLQAVGIAEPKEWNSLTTQWVMKWLPNQTRCLLHILSSSLSVLFLTLFYYQILHFNWNIPLFSILVLGWKKFLFLHLCEKMSLCLVSEGTRLLQLSPGEGRYSMWVPVLNIFILPDIKMLLAPLFPHTVTYPKK